MMKIRVFDDEYAFRGILKHEIEKVNLPKDQFDVGIIGEEDFLLAIKGLSKRREAFRETGTWDKLESNLFDDISILFIDFDLFELKDNPYLKADSIAYLIRGFSKCGIIVRVNRFGHKPFDLTLKGDLASVADLDVGVEQLSNPTLWGLEHHGGFSPWYWPTLPKFIESFEKRTIDVEKAIEKKVPIWEVLGFSSDTWQRLPRTIVQFFGSSDEKLGFDKFLVESKFGLEFKDGQNVLDKFSNLDLTIFSRFAAARVSKWLEYSVLPEQDILVDAPHMVIRFPSLLKRGKEDISAWNALCVRGENLVPGLNMNLIEQFRMKNKHWVSRPVWFWQGVLNCEDVTDVKEPWNVETPEWVFCEDASAFFKEDECREFKAETISPFTERYVKNFEKVDYFPRERFAL